MRLKNLCRTRVRIRKQLTSRGNSENGAIFGWRSGKKHSPPANDRWIWVLPSRPVVAWDWNCCSWFSSFVFPFRQKLTFPNFNSIWKLNCLLKSILMESDWSGKDKFEPKIQPSILQFFLSKINCIRIFYDWGEIGNNRFAKFCGGNNAWKINFLPRKHKQEWWKHTDSKFITSFSVVWSYQKRGRTLNKDLRGLKQYSH